MSLPSRKTGSTSEASEELPVYVRGTRERYDFGQASKEWWQSRYLPKVIRLQELDRTVAMIGMISRFKAPTVSSARLRVNTLTYMDASIATNN